MSKTLYTAWIETRAGDILVITDEQYLYLLEFRTRKQLEKQIASIKKQWDCTLAVGRTKISDMIEQELTEYFNKERTTFTVPLAFNGTPFQKRVWKELCNIPYGETISYKELAQRVGSGNGHRAVANANGKNKFAIIVPCHRVIAHNGSLGGYSGGLDKKIYLLQHEKDGMMKG